uniref:Uncharacterized protein n=1 Tax=Avena sativa TaxID=4498 RepID=A0ACD5XDX6_AVESA
MKRAREEEPLSLALSLTTDSPTTSADSAAGAVTKKRARRGRPIATSGEGEFVCKTCSRAFVVPHLRARIRDGPGARRTHEAAPRGDGARWRRRRQPVVGHRAAGSGVGGACCRRHAARLARAVPLAGSVDIFRTK